MKRRQRRRARRNGCVRRLGKRGLLKLKYGMHTSCVVLYGFLPFGLWFPRVLHTVKYKIIQKRDLQAVSFLLTFLDRFSLSEFKNSQVGQ